MSQYIRWPSLSGSGSGVTIYPNFAAFPVSAPVGTLAIDASTGTLYEYFASSWQVLAQLGTSTGTPFQEVPAGAINGVNVTFTLSQDPNPDAGMVLFQDGLILNQGTDYTLAGTTITMAVAPNFAQTLYAFYTVAAAGTGVTSLNTFTGAVNIVAGTGITVTPLANNITIAATAVSPLTVVATRGAPTLITAVGGIAFTSTTVLTKNYIAGNGGPVIVTANPQIAAGTVDGQELTLQSRDATNTVEIQDGTGLVLNGPWIGGLDSSITLTWDTVNWVEKCRQ